MWLWEVYFLNCEISCTHSGLSRNKCNDYKFNSEAIKVSALTKENSEKQLINPILDRLKLRVLIHSINKCLAMVQLSSQKASQEIWTLQQKSPTGSFLQRYIYEMPSSIHSPKSLS